MRKKLISLLTALIVFTGYSLPAFAEEITADGMHEAEQIIAETAEDSDVDSVANADIAYEDVTEEQDDTQLGTESDTADDIETEETSDTEQTVSEEKSSESEGTDDEGVENEQSVEQTDTVDDADNNKETAETEQALSGNATEIPEDNLAVTEDTEVNETKDISNYPVVLSEEAVHYGLPSEWKNWSQDDQDWGWKQLGGGNTCQSDGCLVTVITKLIIQCGLKDPNSFNVGSLIDLLNQNGGLDAGGNLDPSKVSEAVPGFYLYNDALYHDGMFYPDVNPEYHQQIVNYINNGYHIALQVNRYGYNHWVAVDEEMTLSTGQIYIMDSTDWPICRKLTDNYDFFNHAIAYTGGTTPIVNNLPVANLGDDFIAEIKGIGSQKLMTQAEGDTGHIEIRSANGSANQLWRFVRNSDSTYEIINLKTGKAIDSGAGVDNPYGVITHTYTHNSEWQKWYVYEVNGGYSIMSQNQRAFLDVNGGYTDDGTKFLLHTYYGSDNQVFTITKHILPENIYYGSSNNTSIEYIEIYKGNSSDISRSVHITPDNATIKTITWTSSDDSICSVSPIGVITANNKGSATIYFTTVNGKTGSVGVFVTTPTVDVSEIKLDKTSLELFEGDTYTFKVEFSPENATYKTVDKWSSSDESVAIVSSNGTVTARSKGTATIKAEHIFLRATGSVYKSTSCVVTVRDVLDKPTFSVTAGNASAAVKWNAVSGATSYRVYRVENGSFIFRTETTSLSYTDTGLTNGRQYGYLVRAFKGSTGSPYTNSDIKYVTPNGVSISKPTFTVTAGNASAAVKWNAVSGATSYRVYRVDNGSYIYRTETTSLSYTDTGLTNGKKYGYLVRAFKGSTGSSYTNSDIKYVTPVFTLAKPTFTVTAGNASAAVKWNAVSGATSYRVYRVDNGTYIYRTETTSLNYTDTGLINGKKYGYLVRAFKGSTGSSYTNSDIKYVTPVFTLAKPTFTTTAGNKQAVVKWNAVSGATAYRIYRKTGTSIAFLKEVTATSYTDTGLTNGTKYGYLVRAFNGNTGTTYTDSDWKYVTPVFTPAKPNFTVTAGNKQATVKWSAVSGATSYRVYRVDNGKYVYLGEITGTSYTAAGLTNGTSYGFLVRAFSGNNGSAYTNSDIKYATPKA